MSNLLKKPKNVLSLDGPSPFERFGLSENPFPAEPVVNKDSPDKRTNGSIYEADIRTIEYEKIAESFLKQPQSSANHLRLGYIIDTSFIGRGNGKSAFLLNLQHRINANYCLDISNDINKCFAFYSTPETGGRTKTFGKFVDCLFSGIVESDIIRTCLATIRLGILNEKFPELSKAVQELDEPQIVDALNDRTWFKDHDVDYSLISNAYLDNPALQKLPDDFPLFREVRSLFSEFVTQDDFVIHYQQVLRSPKDKLDFVFSHMIYFFVAAQFNGAYMLMDNFEQIVQFQSAKQKLEFAFELRSCLFDGSYASARIGFYNFFLVFHAGVPRLISETWASSGIENRSPIASPKVSNHIIPFEKLNHKHVAMLLRKYLAEYRSPDFEGNPLDPFTEEVVDLIGKTSEFNAAKILRMAYDLLEKIKDVPSQAVIDMDFFRSVKEFQGDDFGKSALSIEESETVDLQEKAQ